MKGNSFFVAGNLTDDPRTAFTQAGKAVANFTIASTPRVFNRETSEWSDGEPLFVDAALFGRAAERFLETARKGIEVQANGSLRAKVWEKDGQTRRSFEMDVEHIGFGNSFRQVTVGDKTSARGQQGGQPAAQVPQQVPQQAVNAGDFSSDGF